MNETNPRNPPPPPPRRWKSFIWGFICAIVLFCVAWFLILVFGVFNFTASREPGGFEKTFAPWALNHAIARRAPKNSNPLAKDASARPAGLIHYREHCLPCHGAPQIASAEFAMGLNPSPPPLDSRSIQQYSDGELFWIIKNGIRWSGMPSFGDAHSDEDIWKIVTFVRELRHLTPDEKDKLKQPAEDHEHEHSADHPTTVH